MPTLVITSRLSFATMAGGVAAGATIACQSVHS
jgi:hypothetical protein